MQRPALFKTMEPAVFLGAAALVVAFVLFGALYSDTAAATFSALQTFIVGTFGWFYILCASFLLLFVLWLMFSRYGRIRLGGDGSKPEFGYFAWFTMLFSAGMGTGLVFWGVAEPMNHYLSPPFGEGSSPAALGEAMRISFFHWGLHPWAIYIVFGLSLAYFHFRHELPLAPRSLLYPLIGKRIHGPIGHVVDILATVGTLFGVATSLGFGAMQINTGLGELADVPHNARVQVLIIAVVTAIATISVVSGLHRGIQRLSQANILLAALLLLFVFVAGPTVYLLEIFATSLGKYLQNIVHSSLWMDLRRDSDWQANWTLFYWSWWISWSPFVGVFVARISKGRTVREFVISVLLVPSIATFLWFSVFGGTGLYLQTTAGGLAEPVTQNAALALHTMLGYLPWETVTTVLATLLILIFFVTSSDSGSFVDDMVTSGGHPDPPRIQRVFWALAEGAVAAVLLLAGGLQALRTASLTSGLPMAMLLLATAYGLFRSLRIDAKTDGIPKKSRIRRSR
jgi:choline/glycine/proline betaine transport protein